MRRASRLVVTVAPLVDFGLAGAFSRFEAWRCGDGPGGRAGDVSPCQRDPMVSGVRPFQRSGCWLATIGQRWPRGVASRRGHGLRRKARICRRRCRGLQIVERPSGSLQNVSSRRCSLERLDPGERLNRQAPHRGELARDRAGQRLRARGRRAHLITPLGLWAAAAVCDCRRSAWCVARLSELILKDARRHVLLWSASANTDRLAALGGRDVDRCACFSDCAAAAGAASPATRAHGGRARERRARPICSPAVARMERTSHAATVHGQTRCIARRRTAGCLRAGGTVRDTVRRATRHKRVACPWRARRAAPPDGKRD